ncbi:MAG: hypothetical protein COW42_03875 [Deltaproteobacteria bacterium CG17_big_fil_post_rev_8_21_14_2_50_63_7]|nr:MAG: hypothetical protein COW42_03875 [Deltaproteobacteria bacterium CG17_big_fil_post_rev_8_21_14_2_50_63_7]
MLAIAGLLATSASATTARELSMAELVEASDLVVVAEVLSLNSYRAEDGIIYTDTTVQIDEVLVGEVATKQVVIRQWGGTVGEATLVIPGDAHLHKGEQVVLFLADREPQNGVLFLTGLSQSKYEVVGSTTDGDTMLVQNLEGLVFYDATAPVPFYEKVPPSQTLSGLKAELQNIIGGAK